MDRRKFIERTVKATAATVAMANGLASVSCLTPKTERLPVSQLQKRIAIAMWDYSWILRHHRYGEFENWDAALDGLAERGYNAIRMDAMPQFVVSDKDGTVREEFRSVKDGWTPSMWGNDYTMSFRPREALLEFLPKCRERGIRVGLASWFINHAGRTDIFMEEGGLFRAWDETLAFLDAHGLLDDNILYVDVLNEYPCWHGYEWLAEELKKRSDIKKFMADHPEVRLPDPDAGNLPDNYLKIAFQKEFACDLLSRLKDRYPRLDFHLSLDPCIGSFDNIDLNCFDALDSHIWFQHHGGIPGIDEIASRVQGPNVDYRESLKKLKDYWAANRETLIDWMKEKMGEISQAAARHNLVCGNTEGWGPIFWFDHPETDWEWAKESAEICIDLAGAYPNYKFLCTSNFTHPHFKGMWEDVKWHRKMTGKIRSC
jgi:hypothetical protein